MSRQVFISYSSADRDTAQRICEGLESVSIACWMAPRDVPAGVNYPSAIVDAIHAAGVLVVVLTGASIASRHVLTEVQHAFNAGKRIIPFRMQAVPLSKDLDYFLSTAQWLNAPEGASAANLQKLHDSVAAALRGEPPEAMEEDRSRSRILALTGVLLAAALLGSVYYFRSSPAPATSSPAARTPDAVSVAPAPAARNEPPPARTPAGPKVWTNPKDGAEYVWIPPGRFVMGCSAGDSECEDDEKPAHPVNIRRGFWLGRTEVTRGRASNLPRVEITWAEARRYCEAAGGRLPAEAEWEYAARGGQAEAYYGPPDEIAWFGQNSGGHVHPVASKDANFYGLYDMLGNVSEWVLDRYWNKYDIAAPPAGPNIDLPLAANASATARGGFFESSAAQIRVSNRIGYPAEMAEPIIGFRCAVDR